jgi:hypothetical protein
MSFRLPASATARRFLLVACAIALGAACSAAAERQFTGTTSGATGGSGSGASTSHGGASSHAAGGTGGGIISVGSSTSGGTGGSCSGVHCSADMHSILDCNNAVVTTCTPPQACGAGVCVADPCAAAVANGSTIGCEFYAMVPAPEAISKGSCFAALVANTWTSAVTLAVDYGGQVLDVSTLAYAPSGSGSSITYTPLPNGQLDPGKLAVLFLAQAPNLFPIASAACPKGVTPGVPMDTSISGAALGASFHITTTAPVVAYDIYPYGGALSYVASATLLIPTGAWGTNYIAADGWAEDPAVGDPPFIQIIAAQNATHVTISPTSAIVGSATVAATGKGMPQTYTLSKGQVLQFEQDAELGGSPIQSDLPISVWGGASCMNIPVGTYACDSAHQQLLPIKSLGSEYVGARYADRNAGQVESPPWTIVGAVDGTMLTYDPAPPSGMAPLTLDSRDVVSFNADAAFSVKSQDSAHPFYLAGHMTGHELFTNGQLGDPEMVNVVPPAQFLDSYLFLTDPTYGYTELVFVRRLAKDGTFKDVTLDCVGKLTGWTAVGTGGKYEYTRVDMVKAGAPLGTCNNGVHTSSSTEPFGLTVWGWDVAVSYAYPAGMSVVPINDVTVPPSTK